MKKFIFKRDCRDCGESFRPDGEHENYCKECLYKRNPKRYSKFKIYLKTTLTMK